MTKQHEQECLYQEHSISLKTSGYFNNKIKLENKTEIEIYTLLRQIF